MSQQPKNLPQLVAYTVEDLQLRPPDTDIDNSPKSLTEITDLLARRVDSNLAHLDHRDHLAHSYYATARRWLRRTCCSAPTYRHATPTTLKQLLEHPELPAFLQALLEEITKLMEMLHDVTDNHVRQAIRDRPNAHNPREMGPIREDFFGQIIAERKKARLVAREAADRFPVLNVPDDHDNSAF